jgi:hypothetical protein
LGMEWNCLNETNALDRILKSWVSCEKGDRFSYGKQTRYYCEGRDALKHSWKVLFCCIMICLVALPVSCANAAAPDQDLVLHWKLDGDFRDSSGRNNHGTPIFNGTNEQWVCWQLAGR